MEALLKHLTTRLSTRKYCTIFEGELEPVWAADQKAKKRRDAAIHAFAAKHGLSASITDPGVRVTFKKLFVPKQADSGDVYPNEEGGVAAKGR